MNARFLTDNEIPLARKLLYEVYFGERQWVPEEGNPSNLHFHSVGAEQPTEMRDKYDFDCHWIGCFVDSASESQLVGVCRLQLNANGAMDVQNYIEIPNELADSKTAEIARLAIHPKYQSSPAHLAILIFAYQWLSRNEFSFCLTTASFPQPGNMYVKMGMQKHTLPPFLYSKNDVEECELLYFKFGDDKSEKPMARIVGLHERVASFG